MKKRSHLRVHLLLLCLWFVAGCAGISRGCSSCWAGAAGADWVVVQVRSWDGKPYRCWTLTSTSVSNENSSDGIYWKDDKTGNLVHIAGQYNRVQVENNNWEHAFHQVGLTREGCKKIHATLFSGDPAPEVPATKPIERPRGLQPLQVPAS